MVELHQPIPFQFHEGSINTAKNRIGCTLKLYFNSMKVRLIHSVGSHRLAHNEHFNSMKVRLILRVVRYRGRCLHYFNSMKVRLIPAQKYMQERAD